MSQYPPTTTIARGLDLKLILSKTDDDSLMIYDMETVLLMADAHVGTRLTVQKGTRVLKRNPTNRNAKTTMLLLCTRLQEQY